MLKHSLLFTLACLTALCPARAQAAGTFRKQIQKANTMLESGNPAGARDKYRELMTEDPESPVLQYNLGLADCSEAGQFGELGSIQDAIQALDKAKEAFEKVEKTAKDPALRDDAAFNCANATAQQAEIVAKAVKANRGAVAGGEIKAPQDLYKIAVESFEDAVAQYEDLLDRRPDHAGAKQNLDHVRYLLKSMLQNPPPPQQQQQQSQGDQEKQQDQQDKDQQKEGDQKNQGDQENQENQQQEQQQAQQQQAQQQNPEEQQQEQQDQAQAAKDLPEKNVEALLQSLEETDKRERREQKNMQNRGNPVQGKWW